MVLESSIGADLLYRNLHHYWNGILFICAKTISNKILLLAIQFIPCFLFYHSLFFLFVCK